MTKVRAVLSHVFLLSAVLVSAGTPGAAAPAIRDITPASDAPASLQTGKVIPRFLCGAGWETTIILLNTGAKAVAFREFLLAADGTPAVVTLQQQSANSSLTASAIQGTIGSNATLTVVLPDNGPNVQEGWSLLSYDPTQGAINGYAIVRHHASSGTFRFETTIPLSDMQDFSSYLPFDNRQGLQTEMTLVNPSGLAAHVRLTYIDQQGRTILLDMVTLNPGTQATLNLPNTYPDLANTAGMVSIEADINRLAIAGVRRDPLSGAVSGIPSIGHPVTSSNPAAQ